MKTLPLIVFASLLASAPAFTAEPDSAALQALQQPIAPHIANRDALMFRLESAYVAPETFASHSGDALRAKIGGFGGGFQLGVNGAWAESINWQFAYGLHFPAQSTLTLGDGRDVGVGMLIQSLEWGLGYRVASPGGVDLGLRIHVGAQWPVDMDGYVFSSFDGYLAPQVFARLPLSERFDLQLSAGVHFSKDFAPNNPGSTPLPRQSPIPAGSVSTGDATGFLRLDLECLWPVH